MSTTNAQTFTINGVTHQVEDTTARAAIASLQAALNALTSGDTTTAIESFNEIIAFLDNVSDSSTLQGIIAGLNTSIAAKYTKSETGIPATDLEQAVQTLLGKANTAYQKPSVGIPSTDLAGGITNAQLAGSISYTKLAGSIPASKLASAVQTLLGKADTAVQPTNLTGLFASVVYDSTTHRFNFYGYGDTQHTTPLAYIEAGELGGVVDDLDTNDGSKPLSAAQGYVLKNAIDSIMQALANLAFIDDRPTMPWDNSGTPETYVQNGLVFHLDGINKGNVAGSWVDLIGGVDFPNHGATALDNGWQFDGVDDYLGYANDASKSLPFIAGGCTVEIAFYDDMIEQQVGTTFANSNLFYFGANSVAGTNNTNCVYISHSYSSNQRYINGMYVGDTTNVWADPLVDVIAPHTLSINKERAFDNEQALSSLGKNHWDSISGGRTIGAKQHPSNGLVFNFKGKIFAIRIYNRILTEAEMRQNQRVDNARFNLGIALPSAD